MKKAGSVLLVAATPLVVSTAHQKYEYPEFGWKNAVVSTLLAPLRFFNLKPYDSEMTVQQLKADAMKEVSSNDLSNAENGLEFIDKVMRTPTYRNLKYTNFGTVAAYETMKKNLVCHLKVNSYCRSTPAVNAVTIKKPVIVTGLFRSGTTYLHRLLALDEQFRAPLLWELLNPVPGTISTNFDDLKLDRESRRKIEVDGLEIGREIGGWDRFDSLHIVGADLPEECQVSFGIVAPFMPMFQYSLYVERMLLGIPINDAYEHYKKVLKILSFQVDSSRLLIPPLTESGGAVERTESKRWLLKAPLHLFFIKELAQSFPDAQLIL
jgi:hypothetical protein